MRYNELVTLAKEAGALSIGAYIAGVDSAVHSLRVAAEDLAEEAIRVREAAELQAQEE